MCLSEAGAWQLHGILSTRGDCDQERPSGGRPAVFTDIMEMRGWIVSTIGELSRVCIVKFNNSILGSKL